MKFKKDLLIGMAFLGVVSLAVLAHVVRFPTRLRAQRVSAVNNLAHPFPDRNVSLPVPSALTNESPPSVIQR